MPTDLKIFISSLLATAIGYGAICLLPAVDLYINFWPQIIIFCFVVIIAWIAIYNVLPPAMKED